jgi:hypothetical protein
MAAAAMMAMAVVPAAKLHSDGSRESVRAATRAQESQSATGPSELVIPFVVGPPVCVDRFHSYVVSMRIYNVLAQLVSIPTLERAAEPPAVVPAELAGSPLSNLRLSCGRYLARWNGRHMTTGRRLAPGVYLVELVIDGQRITRKVTLGP